MSERTVHTYCRICVQSCGIDVTVDGDTNEILGIEPDRQNVHTWRDFCKKGKTADQVVRHPRRIQQPMRRVGQHYEPATYEDAIGDIATRLNVIIDRHGPDAVGTYTGNPMAFSFATTTFWNGLQDAMGTGNRFWVGSVDTNNLHLVCDLMYGSEFISLVPDIDDCDFFLFVGMDPAISKFNWVFTCPDGWNRVLARKRDANAQIVVVDPRRSATAEKASQYVAVRPGQDWALLLGLIKVIIDEKLYNLSTAVPLNGFDVLVQVVASADLADLGGRCGVEISIIERIAREFAGARTAMCDTHTGVSHSEYGTVAEWLAHVLNLITNRMDRPGGKRFERGFLDVDKIVGSFAPPSTHRTRLRDLPTIAGYHSVAELTDEIRTPGPGQIKALLVAFGNPVVSAPDGHAMDQAFTDLDLLVSIDLVQRESHRHADWLIPGTHWLERDDLHPLFANLNDHPFVQYGRKAVDKPNGLLEEWEFFTELALAMNRNLFAKPGINTLVRTSRRLARLTNRPKLALNPEWIQRAMVAMGRGVSWKEITSRPHGWRFAEPRFGDLAQAVCTPDKHIQLAPPRILSACREALTSDPATDDNYPLVLINKRARVSMNSWLNETPGLYQRDRTNVAEMNSADAAVQDIESGDTVCVSSATGSIEIEALVTDTIRAGVVCIPHGWGSAIYDPVTGGEPETFGSNRNLLVSATHIDQLSQIPKLNSTPVRIRPIDKTEPLGTERPT